MYGATMAPNAGYVGGAQAFDAQIPSPKSLPQIMQRIDELDKVTHQLHEAISEVENRAMGVLRPAPPGADVSNSKPEGPSAPLATALREMTDRVRIAIGRLRDLNDRIEL